MKFCIQFISNFGNKIAYIYIIYNFYFAMVFSIYIIYKEGCMHVDGVWEAGGSGPGYVVNHSLYKRVYGIFLVKGSLPCL